MNAGELGAVTIATNMAGRGVDIKLGEGVRELGGLYVLGTERHEARRIDNQLRGRSGRQGDPGESRFYLSAQDELVRLFAGDRIYNIIDRFKLPDDEPMEPGILSKQIENAQKKVEEQNFVSRKNVLKYDDVMNVQRMVIYEQRRHVLEGADLSEEIEGWIDELVARIVFEHTESEYREEWDLDSLFAEMQALYETRDHAGRGRAATMTREELIEEFQDDAADAYAAKVEEYGPELMREVERYLVLQVVDVRWREHLESMEYLRDGIHLRAMAQKDPLSEYRAEGHGMFEELTGTIQEEIVRYLLRIQIEKPPSRASSRPRPRRRTATASPTSTSRRVRGSAPPAPTRRRWRGAGGSRRRRPRERPAEPRPRSRRAASASSPRRTAWAGTTRAPAARARSTRSATARSQTAPISPRLTFDTMRAPRARFSSLRS